MGFKVTHMPFSSAPAITSLMGGNIDIMFDALPSCMAQAESGRIAAGDPGRSALSAAARRPPRRNWLSGLEAAAWFGVMARAGTPDSSIGAMNKAINQALQKQELIDKLRRIGAQPMPGSQQDFARFIDAERKQWCRWASRSAYGRIDAMKNQLRFHRGPQGLCRTAGGRGPAHRRRSVRHRYVRRRRARQAVDPCGPGPGRRRVAVRHHHCPRLAHAFVDHGWYHQLFEFPGRKLALNYGFDKVRFPAPVPSGSALVGSFRLARVDDLGPDEARCLWEVDVRVAGAERPAMVAEWLMQLRY